METEATEPLAETEHLDGPHFTDAGPRPPVARAHHHAHHRPTASERAFDDRDIDAEMSRILEAHGGAIAEASALYGIPSDEILAVIMNESRGVATANAGRRQRDHGKHAASGLMQVTQATWERARKTHRELASYDFATYRYDPRVNILVGASVLADKRHALARMGIKATGTHMMMLSTMAYNAGEGIVKSAYNRAHAAGSKHPDVDCLKPQFLKPAIAEHPAVYAYYLTGGGTSRNPQRTVERAVELKYEEISRYPAHVEHLVADADRLPGTHRDHEVS